MHGQRAFTLIEVLVVLVILGVLASAVVPSLPGWRSNAAADAAEAWLAQAEEGARRALAEGRPWQWEIGAAQARLLVREQGRWLAVGERLVLPEGVSLARLEIEGRRSDDGGRIEFGDVPPLFSLQLRDAGESWRIVGQASGFIQLERGG